MSPGACSRPAEIKRADRWPTGPGHTSPGDPTMDEYERAVRPGKMFPWVSNKGELAECLSPDEVQYLHDVAVTYGRPVILWRDWRGSICAYVSPLKRRKPRFE